MRRDLFPVIISANAFCHGDNISRSQQTASALSPKYITVLHACYRKRYTTVFLETRRKELEYS